MIEKRNISDVCMDISTILEDYERDKKGINTLDINNLSIELSTMLKNEENNDRLIDGAFLDLASHLKHELSGRQSVTWEYLSTYENLFGILCNEFPCLAEREIEDISFVSYSQLRRIESSSYIYCKKNRKGKF